MAELVGLVASSIALAEVAGKVGGRALALKRLWDEVQEVPETIACLLREIEILDPILAEMENEFAPRGADGRPAMDSWNDTSARLSLAYCRQATADLDGLLRDLSADLNAARMRKRGRAKMQVILKKETLQKFQDRLQSAVRLLSLAQQSYLVALTRLQPDIIVGRLQTGATTFQTRDDEDTQDTSADKSNEGRGPTFTAVQSYNKQPRWKPLKAPSKSSIFGDISWDTTRYEVPFHETCSDWCIRIRTPSWLGQKAWDVQLSNAIGGWQFNVKSYCIRPFDSPVFRYAWSGNTKAIYDLLVKGEASIYDCDEDGHTLLHTIAMHNQCNATRELVSWGFDISASTGAYPFTRTPMHVFFWRIGLNAGDHIKNIHDILLSYDAYDKIIVDGSPTELKELKFGFSSVASFQLLQPIVFPTYYQLSGRDRLKWVNPWRHGDIEILFYAIAQNTNWHVGHLEELQNHDICFLSIMSICYGSSYATTQSQTWIVADETRLHMRKVAAVTSNLSFVQNPRRLPEAWKTNPLIYSSLPSTSVTPLLLTLNELIYLSKIDPRRLSVSILQFKKRADARIRCWLEDLSACGIDLDSYGRTEHDIFSAHKKIRKLWYPNQNLQWLQLSEFDYGATPEDWVFHWDIVPEDYIGNFWHLVDNPPLNIPGEWIDEDSVDDKDNFWRDIRYNSSDEELDSEDDSEEDNECLEGSESESLAE